MRILRSRAVGMIVLILVTSIALDAAALHYLPAGVAVAVMLAVFFGTIEALRLLRAQYPKHGWI